VTVKVFNTAAELVRRAYEADVPAGQTVDAVWDGRNDAGELCSAGVYIVSVQGAGIRRVLKVVVMK
jgi:flagellar hook assembly protein FlgD